MTNAVTVSRASDLRAIVHERRGEFSAALAGRIDPDVFLRVGVQAMSRNPKLLECSTSSLLLALAESASLGLLPTGVLGEAYLVPERNKGGWEAKLRVGYRGLITLTRRSGAVLNIFPATIHEFDRYAVRLGSDRRIDHEPLLIGDRGKPVIYYAVARLADGSSEFWWLTAEEVEAIRRRSRTPNEGPWITDFEAMAWKTVIRAFVKFLPMASHDIARALEVDEGGAVSAPAPRAGRGRKPAGDMGGGGVAALNAALQPIETLEAEEVPA
jgi:recombination protein RecT